MVQLNPRITYAALDLSYSILIAAFTMWVVQAFLPHGLHPVLRMFTAMLGGMAMGCLLGLFASILLGMFETMYLGCFSAMLAGMAGAMTLPGLGLPGHIIYSVLIGTVVWSALALMNSRYQKRSA